MPCTPVMESLESRALLASAGLAVAVDVIAEPHEVCELAEEPTFSVDANGVVRVEGTHGDDLITAFVGANGLLTISANGVTFAVSDSQVSRLEIDAKCGNDVVGVRESVQHSTVVELGNGDDTGFVFGGPARVSGGSGNDLIVTGAYDDRIGGGSGNNIMLGGLGNDLIVGGNGLDGIAGGDGNDTIRGGDGADIILGDGPNTWPVPQPTSDISAFAYLARLGNLGFGHDDIEGGNGPDQIFSGAGNDLVFGGAGDDTVLSAAGNDIVVGGAGNDALATGAGNDWVFGDGTNVLPSVLPDRDNLIQYIRRFANVNRGDDTIAAGAGHDIVFGGRGNDRIHGGAGNDWIHGGEGDDIVDGGAGNDNIIGGAGNDNINGGAGDDRLFGNAGDDRLTGGAGRDYIEGGAGADEIFAIDGEIDTILFDLLDTLHIDGIDELISV